MKKLYLSILIGILSFPLFALNTITVLTPNGGENWIIGCPSTIQWITAAATTGVKIELFKNGTFYLTICSQVPASQNFYIWTPPYTMIQGNDYKVKVTNLSSNVDFDFSDGNFSINTGIITVVSPNGGEVWQKGTIHLVTWTDNICENVRIELWKGGVYNSLITASTPSTGSFTWTIPNNNVIVTGSDYKVKILSVVANSGTTNLVFDFSDNNFTIQAGSGITVITPNGGENWIIGCPNTIQWLTATTLPVKIELYKNGIFCMTICPQVPSGQCTFIWTPPYTLIPGNSYKVKVSALTASGPYDFSDDYFSINTGVITVVSPNGGEVWQKGTTHVITWTDNICENVRIELWKGGVYNSLITYSTPSTGSFTWMIPNANTLIPGNDYKIKILSVPASNTTGIVYDFSDNNFTISQGSFITVTIPNGGEIWIKGTTRIITWIDNIPENVRIELWKSGVFNSLITPSTPSNGSCFWAIPTTIPSGNDFKVKIMALNGSNALYDFSDNNFSIIGPNGGVVDLKSGAAESPENATPIYPNPCNDRLKVKFPVDPLHPVSVEIINLTGKIVLSRFIRETTNTDGFEISTSGLSAGTYIFVIRNSDGILNKSALMIRH